MGMKPYSLGEAVTQRIGVRQEVDTLSEEAKWNTIIEELVELDLTPNEINIYTLLARSGSKKASEISRILKIPKTETYVTLSHLQHKGIVLDIPGRPIRFEALPFEEAYGLLLNRKKSSISSSEETLQSLFDLWCSLPPRGIEEVSSQQFQRLKGLHRIYHKAKEMAAKATKEVTIIASGKDMNCLEVYGVIEELAVTLDNGVNVNLITDFDCQLSFEYNGVNIVRCSSTETTPLPQIIMVDREELMMVSEPEPNSRETSALWTNCTALCGAVSLLITYKFMR